MKTIFVSSTFKDMQQERDVLQRLVLPNVNATARLYGDNVAFCDLRWGVNTANLTEEESNNKVLNVCLDVIDRCEPIMIVILGERYGWQPSSDLIQRASLRKNMQLQDYQISVTALEIEYGSFFRKAKTLVYCRSFEGQTDQNFLAEDQEHAQKLNELKERISAFAYGGIRHYTLDADNTQKGLEQFAQMVQRDVTSLLLEDWLKNKNLTPFGKNLLINKGLFTEHAKSFLVGDDCKNQVIKTIKKGARVVNLVGDAGAGKSTLLGAVYSDFAKMGYEVLPLQVGATAELSTNAGVLNYLLDYFKEVWDILPYDEIDEIDQDAFSQSMEDVSLSDIYRTFLNKQQLSGKMQALEEVAEQFDELGKKLVVLIDGADKLHNDQGEITNCYLPANLDDLSNLSFVITTDQPRAIYGEKTVKIPTYNNDQMTTILCGILAKNHRELDVAVVERVLSKCRNREPLYLKLLLQRLLMMDASDFAVMSNMQSITAHQIEVVQNSFDSLKDVGVQVLFEGAKRLNESFLQQMLQYLAMSKEGLTEQELLSLLPDIFVKRDFYAFFAYMSDLFILRQNGRYDFANSCVKEGVLECVKDANDKGQKIVQLLCDKFFQTEATQPKPDYAVIQELIHVCLNFCDVNVFVQVTSKFIHFDNQLKQNDCTEKYNGAKYALQVYAMCFDENANIILSLMEDLADLYPTATEEYQKQILAVLDLYYDSMPNGFTNFAQTYLGILTSLPDQDKYYNVIATICQDLFTQGNVERDLQKIATYTNLCLENQMQYLLQQTQAEGDLFQVIPDCIGRMENLCCINFENKSLTETVTQHLNFYQNYLATILTESADLLDEDDVAFLGGQVLRVMYASCKLLSNNGDEQTALTAYATFALTYENLPQEYVDVFESYQSLSLGEVYLKIAKLCKKIGVTNNDTDTLSSCLEYFEKYYQLECENENFAPSDHASYLVEMAEVYQMLGQNENYQDCLQQVLTLEEQSLYTLGIQLNSALQLYQATKQVDFALLTVQIAQILLQLRQELYEKMTSTEVIDLTSFADDFDQMKIFINDGAYLSRQFAEDLGKAIGLCQALSSKKVFAQAKILLEQGLQYFDE